MKIKDLLNQKIDLLPFLFGPIQAVIDLFKTRGTNFTGNNTVYVTKQSQPVIIRSEKMMGEIERLYAIDGVPRNFGTSGNAGLNSNFALDMVKQGLRREICDEIMKSDLFEWSIEETAMGTRVAARIIVNKFE